MGDNKSEILKKIRAIKRARMPKEYYYIIGNITDDGFYEYSSSRMAVFTREEKADISEADRYNTFIDAKSLLFNKFVKMNYIFKVEKLIIPDNKKTIIEYTIIEEHNRETLLGYNEEVEEVDMKSYIKKIEKLNYIERINNGN